MPAIAIAERTVSARLPEAFARFIDFSCWDLWMPKGAVPVSGPARSLRVGDRFKLALGHRRRFTFDLEVIRIRPDREVCWRGGSTALLYSEHSFLFQPAKSPGSDVAATWVRSEESLSGLLTRGPFAKRVEHVFAGTSSEILASFAHYLQRPQS